MVIGIWLYCVLFLVMLVMVFFPFVEQNVAQCVLQCECRNMCCDSRVFIKIPL